MLANTVNVAGSGTCTAAPGSGRCSRIVGTVARDPGDVSWMRTGGVLVTCTEFREWIGRQDSSGGVNQHAHCTERSRSGDFLDGNHRSRRNRSDVIVARPSSSSDEYTHMVPLQYRYAALADDNPERTRLREQLISGYSPVAMRIARRFAGRGEPIEDLIQVATVGLINAVDRFDPARGSHFLAFAVPTIVGEVRRYFRDHAWAMRVPRALQDLQRAIRGARVELSQQLGRPPRPSEIAHRLGVPVPKVIEGLQAANAYKSASLDELLGSEEGPMSLGDLLGDLNDELTLIDDRERLRPLLAELTPQQRTVLGLRFFHDCTQDHIAEKIGVSQMQVSRMLRQTLESLRERMSTPT